MMSIVVGRVYMDHIVLGCDSRFSCGDIPVNSNMPCKIISNEKFYIGLTGTANIISLINLRLKDKDCYKSLEKAHDDISITDWFLNFKQYLIKERGIKEDNSDIDFTALFVNETGLYEIYDCIATKITTEIAIGSGYIAATAALHLGYNVQECIQCAIDLNIYCGGKIHMFEMRTR